MNALEKYFKVVPILGVLFAIFSCGNNPEEIDHSSKEPLIVETDEKKLEADLYITNTIPTEDLEDGYYTNSYPNGALQVEGNVVGGKRSGLWKSYHPAGNVQSENNYVNGMLDGKTVVYYANGQIMYIGYYSNDKSDGQWLYFSEDGVLTKEVLYKNGSIVSQVDKNELPVE